MYIAYDLNCAILYQFYWAQEQNFVCDMGKAKKKIGVFHVSCKKKTGSGIKKKCYLVYIQFVQMTETFVVINNILKVVYFV